MARTSEQNTSVILAEQSRRLYPVRMAEKKKSKDQLLAEIAYASGRNDRDTFSGDEAEIVRIGASVALAKWAAQTGGRKPQPTEIELARKKWTAEGCPPEGTIYGTSRYFFKPDGTFDLTKVFNHNFGERAAAQKAGK